MISKIDKIFSYYKKRSTNQIDIFELKRLANLKNAYLVDVRSKQEYNEGHLTGAINIPLYDIDKMIYQKVRDKNAIVILYCQMGGRSKKAASKLKSKGYINVYNLKGGLENI